MWVAVGGEARRFHVDTVTRCTGRSGGGGALSVYTGFTNVPQFPTDKIVARTEGYTRAEGYTRTEGYTRAVNVWALSLVQGPFSIVRCQTLIV